MKLVVGNDSDLKKTSPVAVLNLESKYPLGVHGYISEGQ